LPCRLKGADRVKRTFFKSQWLAAFLFVGSLGWLQGQSYSIAWYKIAGGGGTSTDGPYELSGTIGQPDAGVAMTGGNYSLTGGFWSTIAVMQTPGLPTLAITIVRPSTVVVSWSTNGSFTLQQNSSLAAATWTSRSYLITISGCTNSSTVSPPSGNLFFRLKQ